MQVVWTDAKRSELAGLWLAGRGMSDIAKAMGMTSGAVSTAASDIGLPPMRLLGTVAPEARMRRCMCCTAEFFSAWKGNRLCLRCRGEA